MSIIRVKGDSMAPTLIDGDLVLVDHGREFIDPPGGIYALSINNEIVVKRIQPLFPNGKIRITTDNPLYGQIEVDEDQVKINGKVIWFAREIE